MRPLALRIDDAVRLLFPLSLPGLRLFACPLFGLPARIFLRLLPRLLFLDAAAVFGLEPLAFAALRLDALGLPLHGLFGLAALLVDLVLLLARLLLEHVALDVGAFAADLHIDGPGAALDARQLQLALGLALESDLAGRGIAVVLAPVAAPQMRQQLELRIVADAVVGTRHLDACLVELHEQPVDRHLQHLGELRNRYFCHGQNPHTRCPSAAGGRRPPRPAAKARVFAPLISGLPRTSGRAPS